ncbi:MAG: alpha-galactosidase [Lachnospiraceae bacterium]|nr:alpha-galactosidase [Lachnospiraceae bacterium]
MSITYAEESNVFTLETKNSTYQMEIGKYGHLFHTYYGRNIGDSTVTYLTRGADSGFSGNCHEAYLVDERTYSLDEYKQEYPTFGSADFRSSCLAIQYGDGSRTTELRYKSHRIYGGKYELPGLPAMWGEENQWDTLEIVLEDAHFPVEVTLYYGVLSQYDIITRAVRIENHMNEPVYLERALSACVELQDYGYDMISFYGRHNMERTFQRRPLYHGKQVVDSVRGTSSHQQNPFVILCDSNANEEYGNCYGLSFVYSGNFIAETEVDQYDQTRTVMGIHPTGFRYQLEEGACFYAPEVVCAYSGAGLGQLSRNYHKACQKHLCKSKFANERRPILINNWEATTFDFNEEKLLSIAREAQELGVEMLVMDDGWFGVRNSDHSGLGDWFVNREKLPNGVEGLADKVCSIGMKFGIWVEPEMVNENSDLFREHPDWCLHIPGRKGVYSRAQLVLDMARPEVREYLFQMIGGILDCGKISYVKWDMNRHLTDVWSGILPAERQGEAYHRYVLGLYDLVNRFTTTYPEVLFEGCSGGGGRFDAGWLYYMPQSWCSDDTDAIERLHIQYGTSFGYPISAVGSHVSVVPNQQTGRVTPLHTRGVVAMSGTFGYELDITEMTEEEKEIVQAQIRQFKEDYELIQRGDYYRLTNLEENHEYAAWQFVSDDQKKALLNVVILHARANAPFITIQVKGLREEETYVCKELDITAKGAAFLYAGIPVPREKGDYISFQFHFESL